MGKHTVAVAGATGYAGGEMLRILAAHPDFEVTTVAGHSSVGQPLGAFQPHIPQLAHLIVEDTTPEALNGHDVIVLALPHGASGALAAQLDDDAVIVDLGADHRLEQQQAWDDYYGGAFYEHWVYGMPELILGKDANGAYRRQRERLLGAKRIAGPGCNVTAVTLAMQPGIANNLVVPHTIVADLAVGYSGAGKNLKRTNLLASEALNSAVPYAVGGTHRHIPEILQNFAHAAGLDAAAAGEVHPRVHPDARADVAWHPRFGERETHRRRHGPDRRADPCHMDRRIRGPGVHQRARPRRHAGHAERARIERRACASGRGPAQPNPARVRRDRQPQPRHGRPGGRIPQPGLRTQ